MTNISRMLTMDGNEAVASVAHRTNEVIVLYPITPSSPMGELCDEWSARSRQNLWGIVPQVVEMQSEAGAAGAVHGALQAGALATTFTASQGLLLMIPNMFKIAGELNAFCMHVAARTVATHALSIFGDHSDVMACRQTGFAMLASSNVQEAHDFAAIAQAATLESRIPFLHFFDGFRTSHEVGKVEILEDDDLRLLIDREDFIASHRQRALTPDRPVIRGTAQNPDTFFQARESCNLFYNACPSIVQETMNRFADLTLRQYHLFDYYGHPEAERVLVIMGSGAETAQETVDWMASIGERVGVVKVRLYRPFSISDFAAVIPPTVKSIAVLDRTKEPGSIGEPLYLDVLSALQEAKQSRLISNQHEPRIIGGRYGLSSKEFTPAMVKAVFDELKQSKPKQHFTVGIVDDVTHTSLKFDPELQVEPDDVVRAVFFGLGSDGTVGANKNSIKIIGEETDRYAQGYFVYDSKKAGAITISHLRFGPRPIRSPYLIKKANFVACHQYSFLDRYDILEYAANGAVFLLNSPFGPDTIWDHLSVEVQEQILAKKLHLYTIDAYAVAKETGMGGRINTIMQTCFFALSGVLPREQAIECIKQAIEKTYRKKGLDMVRKNFAAVDQTLANLHKVNIPGVVSSERRFPAPIPEEAPDFLKRVTGVMLANQGDLLPVSAFPVDGTWPLGTTRWEKRNLALEIPVWDEEICIQCNKCAMVCPHAAIRAKLYSMESLKDAPATFKSCDFKSTDPQKWKYTIQVAPEDCTGCTLCVTVCPAKDKSNPKHKAINMLPQESLRESERRNYAFFLDLPELDRTILKPDVKNSQFLEPLFEYSGACAGCGETPYIKLLTQLFGDRLLIANATGCSSIYGGNLPTTPYTTNRDGRGPAWSNSLFEDNSEFGFGLRLGLDSHVQKIQYLLPQFASSVGADLVDQLLHSDQSSERGIAEQRERVIQLRHKLESVKSTQARYLDIFADYLVKKSVWIVGGDGWAYDIGFGGLDHVISTGRDVNLLVLDTEVYSNTGGQQSKATPLGASAKFAISGKEVPKKDLGMMALTYGNVYVARIAFGAKDAQTVQAFLEAESFPGPSLIIAYSHCIAHGYDMAFGAEQQKLAVQSGYWPLFRFDPRLRYNGENPLKIDSGPIKADLVKYMRNEARYRMVEMQDPERFRRLLEAAKQEVMNRHSIYEQLSKFTFQASPENQH